MGLSGWDDAQLYPNQAAMSSGDQHAMMTSPSLYMSVLLPILR
jgi:hypothetical protein